MDTLRAELESKGQTLTSFASYDYLGLAKDPRVLDAAAEAVHTIGIGSGASRLVGGERSIHRGLEQDIADFIGVEDSLCLVSGYMTNVSFVGHMLMKGDLLLIDDLSHNSIIVGTEISRATVVRFPHNDLAELDAFLNQHRSEFRRVIVVVEGLYSMDGDLPDLPRLIELKKRHNFWLMVDEAHSLGVLGASGRGIAERFGIRADEIDFIIGTLSKSLAGAGGFIAGRKFLIDWLRFTLPAFVYSVGLPPVIAHAVRKCIAILREEPWLVEKLHRNSQFFLSEARARGLEVGPAVGEAIVPVIFPDPYTCLEVANGLVEYGFYAPPVVLVGVPKEGPRIRCFISSAHTDDEMIRFLDALKELSRTIVPLKGSDDSAIDNPWATSSVPTEFLEVMRSEISD
ncbi:MAG: aminotransferase class I/II-fold pyridoxal phosphate-dependent enzyme [Sphingomonadales bacterium]